MSPTITTASGQPMLSPRSEADAVADLALAGAEHQELTRGDLILHNGQIVDLARYDDQPRRVTGDVELHDVASLVAYCKDHEADQLLARVYVDSPNATFVAVLNAPRVDTDTLIPSWGDHRAHVSLVPSIEWRHWTGNSGQLLDQVAFAHHIERHIVDVRTPDGATLLEIVSSIEGTKNVEFTRAERLDNGQRRFLYRETIEGRAGATGQLEIPSEFTLGIPVFDGDTEGYAITARLRWRITGEGLKLGYELDRTDVVWRDAVLHLVQVVEAGLGLVAYRGCPPPLT